MPILATLSSLAPLLGFLGTVVGMVLAFASIEAAGDVPPELVPELVSGGIKVALLSTAAGLTIAIPISIAHNYFVQRIDELLSGIDKSAERTVKGAPWLGDMQPGG